MLGSEDFNTTKIFNDHIRSLASFFHKYAHKYVDNKKQIFKKKYKKKVNSCLIFFVLFCVFTLIYNLCTSEKQQFVLLLTKHKNNYLNHVIKFHLKNNSIN